MKYKDAYTSTIDEAVILMVEEYEKYNEELKKKLIEMIKDEQC